MLYLCTGLLLSGTNLPGEWPGLLSHVYLETLHGLCEALLGKNASLRVSVQATITGLRGGRHRNDTCVSMAHVMLNFGSKWLIGSKVAVLSTLWTPLSHYVAVNYVAVNYLLRFIAVPTVT